MPLLKELSRTSQDSFESDSDSKEFQDVRLNSFKSGIFCFFDSVDSIFISIGSIHLYDRYGQCSRCAIDPIDSLFKDARKITNAICEGIKPILPGFFRIGFRFERIPGRSAQFLQKWRFEFFELFQISNRSDRSNTSNSFRIDRINRRPP